MGAYKTGLTHYKYNGKDVYAAKITDITKMIITPITDPGARKLVFGELGGKVCNLVGVWMEEHKPKVGGYFITEDTNDGVGKAYYVSSEIFDRDYLKEN